MRSTFCLLVLLLAMAVSGDLLPWDADAYWAARGLLEELERVPWVGPSLANLLRGGAEVGADTLSRAYILHVLLLPGLLLVLVALQMWTLAHLRRRQYDEAGR